MDQCNVFVFFLICIDGFCGFLNIFKLVHVLLQDPSPLQRMEKDTLEDRDTLDLQRGSGSADGQVSSGSLQFT